jgi:hypothetical protein
MGPVGLESQDLGAAHFDRVNKTKTIRWIVRRLSDPGAKEKSIVPPQGS